MRKRRETKTIDFWGRSIRERERRDGGKINIYTDLISLTYNQISQMVDIIAYMYTQQFKTA
jgi:hypothetical protein